MKHIQSILFVLLFAVGSATARPSDGLTRILQQCLQQEAIHPDSLYPQLRMLERQVKAETDAERRAVMHVALARLYSERVWRASSYDFAQPAHPDSLAEWAQMDYYRAAARHLSEAFAAADVLRQIDAKTWVPLTQLQQAPFREDMLQVAWHTMTNHLDGNLRQQLHLPAYRWIIDYYEAHKQRDVALALALDSLQSAVPMYRYRNGEDYQQVRRQQLEALAQQYASEPFCAEVYLALSRLPELTPKERAAYLQDGLRLYPSYRGKAAVQSALTHLEDPMLTWEAPACLYPGKEYAWQWEVKNVESINWEIYRVKQRVKEVSSLAALRKEGERVEGGVHLFPEHDAITPFTDSLLWTAPAEEGHYVLVLTPTIKARTTEAAQPMMTSLQVKRSMCLSYTLPDGSLCTQAVDALTGAPMDCDCDEEDLPRQRRTWFSQPDTTTHYDLRLFTDRAVYRPGQEVHLAGLAYQRRVWNHAVIGGETYTLKVYDPKRKVVHQQEVTTDAYGVLSSTFSLPEGEVGNYQVVCGSGRSNIRVEEYKRPTFEVTFDELPSLSFPIDTLTLTGHATRYSGAPLSDAQVTGFAQWEPSRWCNYIFSHTTDLDTLRTDQEGRFTLRIPVRKDLMERFRQGVWAKAQVKVQSPDGETHEAHHNLSLCSKSVRLTGWIDARQDRYNPYPIWVRAFGANEKDREMSVTLSLFNSNKELVHTTSIPTHQKVEVPWLRNFEAGRYTLLAETVENGDTARWTQPCILFDELSDRAPVDTAFWCSHNQTKFAPGSTAHVQIASSLPKAYVYMTMSAQGRVLRDTTLCLSGATLLEIPYEERYGKSLTLNMALVSNEKTYRHTAELKLKKPDMELKAHWDTFRDHLRPGQEETWTLTLLNPDGTPAKASLMATLYDASLDAFGRHRLSFTPYLTDYSTSINWRSSSREKSYLNTSLMMRVKKNFTWSVATLNDKYFQQKESDNALPFPMRKYAAAMSLDASNTRVFEAKEVAGSVKAQNDEEEVETTDDVPLRQDFAETAFFFPSLTTNDRGQVALRFRLPESLTRWHLLGLAHTKDLMVAEVDETVTANKDLMATLALPRFLRQGDEAQLPATVQNMTDQRQQGRATLTLLDAATERVLLRQQVTLDLQPHASQTFTFAYNVPSAAGAIVCRWQAQGTDCSDGEQRLLPILSDKEWVEYTQALWLDKVGKQTIKCDNLARVKGDSLRVTLEYTTHPIWAALQALPTMATPRHDNAISLATAYYALATTQWVVQQVPALATDTLFRQPSLREEKMQQWLARLSDLQQARGGFAWCNGMEASRYITTEVAMTLARLQDQTGQTQARDILLRAIGYLQEKTDGEVNQQSLHELYACTLAGVRLNRKQLAVLRQLEAEAKEWSREERALAAIVLHRQGRKDQARRLVKSLDAYLVTTPDRGTYIDYAEGAHRSIDMKLRLHTQLMEALRTVTPDETECLVGMRRWLLQQKRVEGWRTPMQCVDAVYALLQGNRTDLADRERDDLTMRCGNRVLSLQSEDGRRGYVRRTWDVKEAPQQLTVDKRSAGESWGAVYVEALQPLPEVEASSTGLRVEQRVLNGTVQYILTADRDYEYVLLSAERAACLEPAQSQSGCRWMEGLHVYCTVRDSRTEFFIERLPRGTYVLEEKVHAQHRGAYSTGLVRVHCLYAPEFQGHSKADRVKTYKDW